MTLASYLRCERIVHMRYFLAGNFLFAPRWTGRLLTGKSCLQITMRFCFFVLPSILRLLSFIFCFSLSMMSTLRKVQRTTWSTSEEKDFLLLYKERAIADLLEDSPIFIKKVFKILPLRQIATWCRNFERRSILDCRWYGQHSDENESRTEIRCEPFIPAVFVLNKTCSYKWHSSLLMFPRINGPIIVYPFVRLS